MKPSTPMTFSRTWRSLSHAPCARSRPSFEMDDIDGVLFAVSGIVALVPGPNVLAYYFGFRLVGHYLSRQGAKHALDLALWETCSIEPLSRLRLAAALSSHERARQIHQVASELHLPHLATFFERTAIHPA